MWSRTRLLLSELSQQPSTTMRARRKRRSLRSQQRWERWLRGPGGQVTGTGMPWNRGCSECGSWEIPSVINALIRASIRSWTQSFDNANKYIVVINASDYFGKIYNLKSHNLFSELTAPFGHEELLVIGIKFCSSTTPNTFTSKNSMILFRRDIRIKNLITTL